MKTAVKEKSTVKAGKVGVNGKTTTKAVVPPVNTTGLTNKQVNVLKLLAKAKNPVSRSVLQEECKAHAKDLGAATKEGLGAQGGGMEGMGLITSEKGDPEQGTSRQLFYTITSKGRKELEKALKAM